MLLFQTIRFRLIFALGILLLSQNLFGQQIFQDFSDNQNCEHLKNLRFLDTHEVEFQGEVTDSILGHKMTGFSYQIKSNVLLWQICRWWETEEKYDTLHFRVRVFQDNKKTAFTALQDSLFHSWSEEFDYYKNSDSTYKSIIEFPEESDFINNHINLNQKFNKKVIFALYQGDSTSQNDIFFISTKKELYVIDYIHQVGINPYLGFENFCQDYIKVQYPFAEFKFGNWKPFRVKKFLKSYRVKS